MPECKKCKTEIKMLRVEVVSHRHKYAIYDSAKAKMIYEDNYDYTHYQFKCSACHRILFYDPKRAMTFLRKEATKTKW